MPKFKDIKPFTRYPHYCVDVSLDFFVNHIDRYVEEFGLDLNPDFQRGHVWTEDKQIAFVEFLIKGGNSCKTLFFNQPYWMNWRREDMSGWDDTDRMVLVDGKQRIEAIRRFMLNEIPVFGYCRDEYEDQSFLLRPTMEVRINDLTSRVEVLQWYLDLNTGGVVHTPEEIEKVKQLLEQEK